jgi:hypothetical protein
MTDMVLLMEMLDHHRGRGQQQIVVKHVTVNADQAMVGETITTGTPALEQFRSASGRLSSRSSLRGDRGRE